MEQTVNTFSQGLNTDLNALVTPNNVMTNCLNGTLLTYNGNEMVLQNDMGNGKVETAKLPPGYVPVGMKQHGGIIYVASYNPQTQRSQLGCFPSPERNIEDTMSPTSGENFEVRSQKTPLFNDGALHAGDKFSTYLKDINNLSDVTPSFDSINPTLPFTGLKSRYSITMNILNNNGELVDITLDCKPIKASDDNYYWFSTEDNNTYSVCKGRPAGKPYICVTENRAISMEAAIAIYTDEDGNLLYRPDISLTYNCPRFSGTEGKGLLAVKVTVEDISAESGTPHDITYFMIADYVGVLNKNNDFVLRLSPKQRDEETLEDVYTYTELNGTIFNKEHHKLKVTFVPYFLYSDSDKFTLDDLKIETIIDVDSIGNNKTTLNTWKTYYDDDATVITYGFESYISDEKSDEFIPKGMVLKFHTPKLIGDEETGYYTFDLENDLLKDKASVTYELPIEDKSSYNGVFSEYIPKGELVDGGMYIVEIQYTSLNKIHRDYRLLINSALYNDSYVSTLDFLALENESKVVTPILAVKAIVDCPIKLKLTSQTTTQNDVARVSLTDPGSTEGETLDIYDTSTYSLTANFSVQESTLFPVQVAIDNPYLTMDDGLDDHENYSFSTETEGTTTIETLTYQEGAMLDEMASEQSEGTLVFTKFNANSYTLEYKIILKLGYKYESGSVNVAKLFETYESRDLLPSQVGNGLIKFHTNSDHDYLSRDDYWLKYTAFNNSHIATITGKELWTDSSDKNACKASLVDMMEDITTACKSLGSNTPLVVDVVYCDSYLVNVDDINTFYEKVHWRPLTFYSACNKFVYTGELYILLNNNMYAIGPNPVEDRAYTTMPTDEPTLKNPYTKDGILKNFAVCTDSNVIKNDVYVLKLNTLSLTDSAEYSVTPKLLVNAECNIVYKGLPWDPIVSGTEKRTFRKSIEDWTIADDDANKENLSLMKQQLLLISDYLNFTVGEKTLNYTDPKLQLTKTGTSVYAQLTLDEVIPCMLIYGADKKVVFPNKEMDEETVYKVLEVQEEEGTKLTINSTNKLIRQRINGMYHGLFLMQGDLDTEFDKIKSAKIGNVEQRFQMYSGSVTVSGDYGPSPWFAYPIDNPHHVLDSNGNGHKVENYPSGVTFPTGAHVIPIIYNSTKLTSGRMVINCVLPCAYADQIAEFNS